MCMWSQSHQELREWHTAGTRTLAREQSYRPSAWSRCRSAVSVPNTTTRIAAYFYRRLEMAHHYLQIWYIDLPASIHHLWWAPVLKIKNSNHWSICWGNTFAHLLLRSQITLSPIYILLFTSLDIRRNWQEGWSDEAGNCAGKRSRSYTAFLLHVSFLHGT